MNENHHGGIKDMRKKFAALVSSLILISAVLSAGAQKTSANIIRLTFSGNNVVHYPSLSEDGRRMTYILEIKGSEKPIKSVRVMNVEDGKERELFRDQTIRAPAPFQDAFLVVGSKPPVISGKGDVVSFALSLDLPSSVLDHFLAVAKTDGTELWFTSFPLEALQGKDLKPLDFSSPDWERVASYAINHDGNRIACVLKGHLGPRRYGNPSGIIFLDTSTRKQRALLAPDFNGKEWVWPSAPRCPLTGGGWAFCLSSDGNKVVFGAQSSPEKTDYDLYTADWTSGGIKRITDFHDRWFSQADISQDGKTVVFFYGGKTKQGIGTYTVKSDGSGLKYIQSKVAPRIELVDMSGNGRFLFFKHVYKGIVLDLENLSEQVAFDESTPGYAAGISPMDFPRLPAFWQPAVVSSSGERVLLVGPPQGKESPEIYVLSIERKE